MKTYLMFRGKDFDLKQPLPVHAPGLTQDLELNTLLTAMAGKDEFLRSVVGKTIFEVLKTTDEIQYRQEILKDCLKNPDIVRMLYQIPVEASENKRKQWISIFGLYPSGILSSAIRMMEMFIDLLKTLKHVADEHSGKFESEGFRRFFTMIKEELSDDYIASVQHHLHELKFNNGALMSTSLGEGNEANDYVLHKPKKSSGLIKSVFEKRSPVYSYRLDPRDDQGARALGELKDRGLNLVANALAQSADHIDSFFLLMRIELAFYIGCLNFYEQLKLINEPITFPQTFAMDKRKLKFEGLYDVCLALTMKKGVVGNTINADHKDLVMITGANQGGKSTFLRGIGLAQLMMQSGMFVPAESFSANICTHVFTHFKRKEDASMKSGKLDEELSRMSEIVDLISPNALLLFNESFSATNEREGSEIAQQIVSALLDKRVKIFFVTHFYELASSFYLKQMANALFLRAERKSGGQRTFKLIEAEPLQTSFGKDLYQKIANEYKGGNSSK